MPDCLGSELQSDVQNKDMTELRQDLAAAALTMTGAEFRQMVEQYNTDSATNGLPPLEITYSDHNGDGKTDPDDTVEHIGIDLHGNDDGNLWGGVDVYNGENIAAIEQYNDQFLTEHPELAHDLEVLQANGMTPLDFSNMVADLNYLKAHTDPAALAIVLAAYNESAALSGGVIEPVNVENNADGSIYRVSTTWATKIAGHGVLMSSDAAENALALAANSVTEITGTLNGALQMEAEADYCDAG